MSSKVHLMATYALLVFIWSTTPLAIVWSVADMHMLWALVLRFFIALPLVMALLLLLQYPFPRHRVAWHSYFAGSFSLIGSQFFTYLSTPYMSSGVIALMFGLAPIIAGLIGHFYFQNYLSRLQWLGMCIAVSGLAIICLAGNTQHVHPLGIGLMLLSVFSYAVSIFWVKQVNAKIEPIAQAAGSILVSTVAAVAIVPFIWHAAPQQMPDIKTSLALLYTVVMASLIAMFCYFKLVQHIQPTTLSLTTVMTPMLALCLGAILNHEQLSFLVLIGAALLLLGVFIYFYQNLQSNRKLRQKLKHL